MELTTNDDEDALLEESEDEVECSQRTPERKARQNCRMREEPQRFNRKRRHSETISPEEKITHSEQAIKSLKRHCERGTCPQTLQYRARAHIKADADFKSDVKRIRHNAEQQFVQALLNFHHREINRSRVEIKRGKRPKASKRHSNTDVNKKTERKKIAKSTASNYDVTLENVQKLADSIQDKFESFSKVMSTLQGITNKHVEKYTCLFSDSNISERVKRKPQKPNLSNRKRKERKQTKNKQQLHERSEANKKHIKNLSNKELTNDEINLLAKGLKFIPTPVTKEIHIKRQLLRDFEQFARRMRLCYIYRGEEKEAHPYHVKSTWNPPLQPSVALETYLEEVKVQLAETKLTKPKNNLQSAERKALVALKRNHEINLKKADKGTTTVVMNIQDKINEGQIQLDNIEHYRPLEKPMIKETNRRVKQLISELHRGNHIDDMTQRWLCQTPSTPRTPTFYTLTKIHKPIPVGRPIISGCEGPTERLSSFVDKLLQPIAKQQVSYLKDTMDFINFIERTKVPTGAFLVSMDVTNLYTNIPQEEGIQTICKAYDAFYKNKPPIPTNLLERALRLILTENSFQFKGKDYLQIHGTAMGTKMAVAFANIFMAKIETEILSHSATKPLVWKRFIDDVISIWNTTRKEITQFIEQANSHHPTIRFTAEISETETTFLDTEIYKGERFNRESVLDVRTHFKPTETFQYTHFSSCHPTGVKRGFVKGEALRLLRTNSSKKRFEENKNNFKAKLLERGYPENFIKNILSEVNFEDRGKALQQKDKENKRILPFVTQYQPSVPNLKQILLNKWHLIEEQPALKEIYKGKPLISYRKGRSLKDTLVRAKL